MINRFFNIIFSAALLFSPTNSLYSDEIISIPETDIASEVLKDYYNEFAHDIVHGEKCQCRSELQKTDLLGSYYSEFSK